MRLYIGHNTLCYDIMTVEHADFASLAERVTTSLVGYQTITCLRDKYINVLEPADIMETYAQKMDTFQETLIYTQPRFVILENMNMSHLTQQEHIRLIVAATDAKLLGFKLPYSPENITTLFSVIYSMARNVCTDAYTAYTLCPGQLIVWTKGAIFMKFSRANAEDR